jgi:hypothetical protein
VRTEFSDQGSGPSGPSPHAYDDPDLSPKEFLQAVMHATNLPMVSRVQAASALLPYTNSIPRKVQGSVPYHCRVIIGGLGPGDGDLGSDPTGNHSQNPNSLNTTLTHGDDTVAPLNLTTIPDPPTSDDLLQIKAAVDRLRPDLAHLPIPEPRLCQCGHWMFGPCPLGDRCRDRSKLN